MRQIAVGIADLAVCAAPDATLVTGSLGSGVAVVVWDPEKRVGGVLHVMLPLSRTSPDKAHSRPAMFADTGVPLLLSQVHAQGCRKEDLVVKVVGGGSLCGDGGILDIGGRNIAVLREVLEKSGVAITSEDVGGSRSRTVRLRVRDGAVFVGSRGKEEVL